MSVSTQVSAHSSSEGAQAHTPASQTDAQGESHRPQCAPSVRTSTQRPAQSSWFVGQSRHMPSTHVCEAPHGRPQPPQCASSTAGSTQLSLHEMSPSGHAQDIEEQVSRRSRTSPTYPSGAVCASMGRFPSTSTAASSCPPDETQLVEQRIDNAMTSDAIAPSAAHHRVMATARSAPTLLVIRISRRSRRPKALPRGIWHSNAGDVEVLMGHRVRARAARCENATSHNEPPAACSALGQWLLSRRRLVGRSRLHRRRQRRRLAPRGHPAHRSRGVSPRALALRLGGHGRLSLARRDHGRRRRSCPSSAGASGVLRTTATPSPVPRS